MGQPIEQLIGQPKTTISSPKYEVHGSAKREVSVESNTYAMTMKWVPFLYELEFIGRIVQLN